MWGQGDFGIFEKPQKLYMDGVDFVDVQISKFSTNSPFAIAIEKNGAASGSDLISDSGPPAVVKTACTSRSHVKKVHRRWHVDFGKGKEGRQEVKKKLQAQSRLN